MCELTQSVVNYSETDAVIDNHEERLRRLEVAHASDVAIHVEQLGRIETLERRCDDLSTRLDLLTKEDLNHFARKHDTLTFKVRHAYRNFCGSVKHFFNTPN